MEDEQDSPGRGGRRHPTERNQKRAGTEPLILCGGQCATRVKDASLESLLHFLREGRDQEWGYGDQQGGKECLQVTVQGGVGVERC